MSTPRSASLEEKRPPFMAILGLSPPYTPEDIEAAYHEKAKTVHPDRGGTQADFQTLHEAFERAREYVKFRVDRRRWLAARVESYLEQDGVVNEVHRLGGLVEVQQIDWIKRSFGDFAVVTEMLRGIGLRGLTDGDAFLAYLVEHAPALQYLLWLDVSGSRISDDAVLRLPALASLQSLDLSGTPISTKVLEVVKGLPGLQRLNLGSTSISSWARWRLRRSFPHLEVMTKAVK